MSVIEFAEGLMHILEDNGYEGKGISVGDCRPRPDSNLEYPHQIK